ncbi:MAG: tetratricopeptide repeat protein [Cyanobacteria bacterium P01_F01_bin.150]
MQLEFSPETRTQQFHLIGQGETLAGEGQFQQAIALFEEAIALDPTLEIDLKELKESAKEQSISALMTQSREFAAQGNIDEAITALNTVMEIDPNSTSAAWEWNAVCWKGSLSGAAQKVLNACENAVDLNAEDGNIRDSRGLARALTGDVEGAIADFQFFIEQTNDEEERSLRQQWIKSLNAGENPFTSEVLESLQ